MFLFKSCKFQQKCTPFNGFTKINANDQLDLIGSCYGGCYGTGLIYTYSIYMYNNNTNQWTPFTNSSYYYQTGPSNADLTMLSDLFMANQQQVLWQIELTVFITSRNVSGFSSVIMQVNFPPMSGICNINPLSGTTNTLFTINCINWIDPDGSLVSFSYYGNNLKVRINYVDVFQINKE